MLKATLYSFWPNQYESMRADLGMYVGSFAFEADVRPFMLPHRQWDLYAIDTQGMDTFKEVYALDKVSSLVKTHPTRIFAIWSQHTWRVLSTNFTSAAVRDNCILADGPGWINDLTQALRVQRRLRDEES